MTLKRPRIPNAEYVLAIERAFPRIASYKRLPHREKAKLRSLFWKLRNPEKYKAIKARHMRTSRTLKYARYRPKVIVLLGGKCFCCGESRLPFLTIDHISPAKGFYQSNKTKRPRTLDMMQEILAQENPRESYRILCWNCNCATRYRRVCPHNEAEVEAFLAICRDVVQTPNSRAQQNSE